METPHYKFRKNKFEGKPRPRPQSWALDNEKLSREIYRKLNRMKKPQRYLTEALNISRSTLHRIDTGKVITLETFFKLMEWLDADLNQYIKKNGKD